jgi:hypothetical protein
MAAEVTEAPRPGRRDFGWFWSAFTVSTIGDQVTLVALPLAAFLRTGDPLAVGIATSMEAITIAVFGLMAGALADRWSHRRVLVATDVARVFLLGGLALVVTNHRYPVGVLYAVAFAMGAMRQLHDAAAVAALPRVVVRDQLLRANSQLNGSESAGNTIGPALAGALVALGGVGLAFAADALSFLGSALGLGRVRGLSGGRRRPEGPIWPGLWLDIVEGLRAVRANRTLRWATLLVAGMNIPAVTAEAQFIPYGKRLLHLSALGIGAFFALGGVAGVAAAAVMARSERGVQGRLMLVGVGVLGGGVLLAGLWPSRAGAAIAFVALGAGSMVAGTEYAALRQEQFPVSLLGRVGMVTRTLLRGLSPVVLVAGGLVARAFGEAAVFTVTGLAGLAAVGLGLVGRLDRVGNAETAAES